MEKTFAIIKPDAVAAGQSGEIIAIIQKSGFRVAGMKMRRLSHLEAEGFYAVHRERPFYRDLVRYMSSGPVIAQILEGEGSIAKHRDLMGATDPKKAAPGTIRADLAQSIEQNVVHGSDGPETAASEIAFFFSATEICPRD